MSHIARVAPENSASLTIREFIRIEKNLTTLGFFTPTQGRGKILNKPKVLRIRREIPGGKVIEAEATIIPSVEHGLPTTPDQDKYLAFQQIVQDRRKANGGWVQNPIPFTSYDLCNRVGLNTGGKNYADISEWLDRMVATTIRSKGTVYLAKRKTYVKDTFHVFDRVVVAGEDLPDGKTAEQNYVWLSEWQIENLNEGYQLPVDFERYKQLRTHIGKALVPLLQVWLFPTRTTGRFEKRYTDVCELLSLRPQSAPSLIERQLGPALNELLTMGYISNWSIQRTADNLDYKLILFHGPKFLNDLKLLTARSDEPVEVQIEPPSELMQSLIQRGLIPRVARKLLESLPSDQPVQEQLEWCDSIIQRGKIDNPPGLIYSVLKYNEVVPDSFETSKKRNVRLKKEEEDVLEYTRRVEQQQQYEQYIESALATCISEKYTTEDYETAIKRFAPEVRKQYPNLPLTTIREICEGRLKQEVRASLHVLPMEEFITRQQFPLFS
jgi:Replication initiator protein A